MNVLYYPDESNVTAAMEQDEPLLALVSFNGEQIIVSQIDEALNIIFFCVRQASPILI